MSVTSELLLTFSWLIILLAMNVYVLLMTEWLSFVIFFIPVHASVYKLFAVNIHEERTEPIGMIPDVSRCVFAMHHSKIDEADKEES